MRTIEHKPPTGERVIVIRQSGKRVIARRDYKPDAFFRNPDVLHWLDDNDKFTDVAFDPVIAWLPLNETNMIQHCETCGTLLSLPHMKKCRRCMELNDMLMPLMRNEQARAALIGELMTPSMVAAIVDIDSAYGYGEANEYDVAQEEGWAQLATIATSVYKKKMGVQ